MNNKIKHMRLALAVQHIGLKEIDIEKIIATYEAINKKGGSLTIKEIAELECSIEDAHIKKHKRLFTEE